MNSTYNGLAIRAEKRYKAGLQFLVNYVFSKFIDDAGFQDQYNRQLDKSLSGNDRTHNTSFSLIWDTPLGKGRKWINKGPLSQIIGGWQLSVLGMWQSGPRLGIATSVNNCNCFSAGAQRPNILGDPTLPDDQRTRLRWFDTTRFSQPAPNTFGNASRTIGTRAPGMVTHNMGIMKNFPFLDRFKLQARAEMFNAFNHTNFGGPAASFGSTTFGIISSAAEAREIQLGLKLYF